MIRLQAWLPPKGIGGSQTAFHHPFALPNEPSSQTMALRADAGDRLRSAAGSLREGLAETLTIARPGAPDAGPDVGQ